MTKAVSDADFEKMVLKSSVPVVVDFWAEWCGPCKQIAPALEEISKELGDTVQIVKMNVDENQIEPSKYGIRGIPTLLIFKDGKVLAQKVGAAPKKALSDWIKSSTGAGV
jgi:thioredoxin 1